MAAAEFGLTEAEFEAGPDRHLVTDEDAESEGNEVQQEEEEEEENDDDESDPDETERLLAEEKKKEEEEEEEEEEAKPAAAEPRHLEISLLARNNMRGLLRTGGTSAPHIVFSDVCAITWCQLDPVAATTVVVKYMVTGSSTVRLQCYDIHALHKALAAGDFVDPLNPGNRWPPEAVTALQSCYERCADWGTWLLVWLITSVGLAGTYLLATALFAITLLAVALDTVDVAWSKLWANISDGLIERGIYFWPSAAFRASTDLTVWLAQSFIAPSAKRLGDAWSTMAFCQVEPMNEVVMPPYRPTLRVVKKIQLTDQMANLMFAMMLGAVQQARPAETE